MKLFYSSVWSLAFLCIVCQSDPQPSALAGSAGSKKNRNDEGIVVSQELIYQAGETANLPCDISVPSHPASAPNDELMLIMWYREDVRSPIYSIDARSGIHIPSVTDVSGSHWMDTTIFGHNRVVFDTSPGPQHARLKIFNVSESDDGIYRCRVDFKASQTRTSRLNLTVVVPPSKPVIRLAAGGSVLGHESVEGYLGPYQIGTRLSLVCQVNGGKPAPRVVWYRNGRIFSTATSVTSNPAVEGLVTVNNITLESLSRDDVHTKLTCQTTNFEATTLRSSVELDMKYQAHNVTIHNKERSLRAGSQHEFTCEALGSRPAAVITWWFDDQQIHPEVDNVQITSSVSGELSTSTMTYTPRSEDSGKTLHCRATNPEMHQGVLEDQWKLDVQYPPQVSIRMGKSLVASDIREGVDVYFSCVIRANPAPKTKIVTWLHNNQVLKQNRDDDLRARMVLPSVNDPNVLVLQGVKKAARGNYSCRVGNGIPTHDFEVESDPIFLDVKFPPVCKPKGVKVYGVAKMETAHIACNVEANPPEVSFRWTFNNSAEAKTVSSRFIRTNGSTSLLTFTPTRTLEYGTLMCWSWNSVGEQRDPCIFHIIAAGKPEAVQNCTVSNESTDSFQVTCQPGFNGGLPQHFTLTVYKVAPENGELHLSANLSSSLPGFTVSGLDPGSKYVGELVGHNVKGMGVPTQIHVYTLKLPEKLIPNIEDGSLGSDGDAHPLELDPLMLTILGVVAGVLIVIIIVTLAIRIHASRSRSSRLRNGRSGDSGSNAGSAGGGQNKVVVTTIEELDIDHHSSTASLMVMDHRGSDHSLRSNNIRSSNSNSTGLTVAVSSSKNPDLVPFIQQHQNQSVFSSDDFSLLRHSRQQHPREYLTDINGVHHRRSSLEASSNAKDLTPPPPPPPVQPQMSDAQCRLALAPNAGSSRHPLVDFCTLRRGPPSNHRPRAVQFADQQQQNPPFDQHHTMVITAMPPVPDSSGKFPAMYATMRPPPPPRGGSSGAAADMFPEFVPPPPPMFDMKPALPPGKPDAKMIANSGAVKKGGKGEKKRESTV